MASWLVDLIGVSVDITVALVAFNVGMNTAWSDLSALWQRRGLLVRSLIGVLLVVPLLAVLLVKAMDPPAAIAMGLLVTAISVGPVAALNKSAKQQAGVSFALALEAVLLASSLVFVPLAAWAIGAAFEREVHLSVAAVAGVVLPLQLVPLVAGLAVGRLAPSFARRVSRALSIGTNLVLGAVLALVLVAFFKSLLAVGSRGLLEVVALSVSALLVGHVLGGPGSGDRKVLAAFTALRFPALALAMAQSSTAGRRAVPTVLAYVIFSGFAYSLYSKVIPREEERVRHPPDSRPRPLPAS